MNFILFSIKLHLANSLKGKLHKIATRRKRFRVNLTLGLSYNNH